MVLTTANPSSGDRKLTGSAARVYDFPAIDCPHAPARRKNNPLVPLDVLVGETPSAYGSWNGYSRERKLRDTQNSKK
jgi:hypothetical protein